MEEFYRWYNPNTKTYGEKYTWRQLMYSFYEDIARKQKPERRYNWRLKKYEEPEVKINPHDHYLMEYLFHSIGHSDKDTRKVEDPRRGYWVTNYVWVDKEPAILDNEGNVIKKAKQMLVPKKEYISYPNLTIFKSRIVDAHCRAISSGYVKHCYKMYIPNPSDKKVEPLQKVTIGCNGARRWWYSVKSENVIINGYNFRKGPVPGITGHWNRGRSWERYHGKHCGIKPWKRDWYAAKVEQKEIREEHGVTYKMPDKAPYPYHRTHQRGWKRTRKKRQWM